MSRRRIRLTPLRRHVASILTIALSTAFVAVMMIGGSLLNQALETTIASMLRGSDIVASPQVDQVGLIPMDEKAPAIDEATATWPLINEYVEAWTDDWSDYFEVGALPPAEAVDTPLESGRHAQADGEVVIDSRAADKLGVSVGDTITTAPPGAQDQEGNNLTVVGIARVTDESLLVPNAGKIYATEHSAPQMLGGNLEDFATGWLYSLKPGANVDHIAKQHSTDDIDVQGTSETVRANLQNSGMGAIYMVVGAFVLIGLITAGVVVANTFTVTLAQRTRDLALLRTVGARKGQVLATVLREAFLVGLIGSLLGVLIGHALVQAALLAGYGLGGLPRAALVPISVGSVIAPLIAGLVITVLASLAPLRRAVSIAPLQALRPQIAAPGSTRTWGVRQILGLVVVFAGLTALIGGTVMSVNQDPDNVNAIGLLIAMAGGALSLAGVLMSMDALIMPVLRLLGSLMGLIGGHPARLAVAQARRNPGRSAATVAALVIATSLMTMMAVGSRTAEVSLQQDLANRKPVDVIVQAESLSADNAADIKDLEGVGNADVVPVVEIDMGTKTTMTTYGTSAQQLRDLTARPDLADSLKKDTVLMGAGRAEKFGVTDGQKLELEAADGGTVTVEVALVGNLDMTLMTPETLAAIKAESPDDALFVRFASEEFSDMSEAMEGLDTYLTKQGIDVTSMSVEGAERAIYGEILNVLLVITAGLLAVSVLVAIVGVMNTLSLSVLERAPENALLRALGTTRGQMRAMLGWEGVLIGTTGALFGVLLGALYGVLGVAAIFGPEYPLVVSIPWIPLAVLIGVAILAGFLASVLPARRAAKAAPTEVLAAA